MRKPLIDQLREIQRAKAMGLGTDKFGKNEYSSLYSIVDAAGKCVYLSPALFVELLDIMEELEWRSKDGN